MATERNIITVGGERWNISGSLYPTILLGDHGPVMDDGFGDAVSLNDHRHSEEEETPSKKETKLVDSASENLWFRRLVPPSYAKQSSAGTGSGSHREASPENSQQDDHDEITSYLPGSVPTTQGTSHNYYDDDSNNSNPSSDSSDFYVTDHEEEKLKLEVAPGIEVEIRSSNETRRAIRKMNIMKAVCLECTMDLYTLDSALYLLCPLCRCVSPLEATVSNLKPGAHGVGLGFQHLPKRKSRRRRNTTTCSFSSSLSSSQAT